MATRFGRANRAPLNFTEAEAYNALISSLYVSRLKFEGKEKLDFMGAGVKDTYLARLLYTRGKFAYDRITGLFLPYSGAGRINCYGEYSYYILFGENGQQLYRNKHEIARFHANGQSFPLAPYVRQRCQMLAEYDGATRQNLSAIKALAVLVVDNEAEKTRLIQANNAREMGESMYILTRDGAGFSTHVELLQTTAQYICDKLQGDKQKEFEHLLHIVGTRTAPEKGERLINAEVETVNSEADSFLDMTLNTVNDEAREQGIGLQVVIKNTRKEENNNNETIKNRTERDGETDNNGTDKGNRPE